MLKVFKRKAMEQREQQASIKIDMALLLKMDHTRSSEVLKTNIPLTRSSPVPVPVSVASVTSTVALPSSESSSCSVGSKDGPKFLISSNQEVSKLLIQLSERFAILILALAKILDYVYLTQLSFLSVQTSIHHYSGRKEHTAVHHFMRYSSLEATAAASATKSQVP
jgi:hypothetical protein